MVAAAALFTIKRSSMSAAWLDILIGMLRPSLTVLESQPGCKPLRAADMLQGCGLTPGPTGQARASWHRQAWWQLCSSQLSGMLLHAAQLCCCILAATKVSE